MAIQLKGNAPAVTPAISKPTKIVQKKLASLQAYEKNPRKNDKAVPAMVDLINRFGFRQPILVRGDDIVDGHLRVKAAASIGMASVPAIDVGDMTDADVKMLRISMNKAAEFAEWDFNLLAGEFEELKLEGGELAFTGFETGIVDKIIADSKKEPTPKPAPTKNTNADAGTPADPNYVSMTFHSAAVSRQNVLTVLNHVRTTKELSNVSQALVALCKDLASAEGLEWKDAIK